MVVPKEYETDVLSMAQSISDAEERILSAAIQGERLDELRRTFKYHELQRRY